MPSAAPVLDIYKSLIGNANPIEAYSRGVELRARLDAIAAKTQADTFQMTLESMKLAEQRNENRQKTALANRELDIAGMNAETNRMNAMRGLKTANAKSAAPAPATPVFTTDEEGNMVMSFAPAAPSSEAQAPSEGQGDGPEVTALSPNAPSQPSVMPSTSPLGGMNTAPPPDMAPPTGEPARAAGAGPTSAPKGAGKLYVTGTSYNTKTGSMSIHSSPIPPKKPGQKVDDATLERQKNFARTWGLEPESITTDEEGNPKVTFGKPKTGTTTDFSVSTLPAEGQKVALPMMTELATLAEGVRSAMPTDAQKMAEVGVTDPSLMTPELWTEGYQRATAKGQVDPAARAQLGLKAREFAAFMNLQFQGKQGYTPSTEASVIASLGIAPIVPPNQQQGQQPAAAGGAPAPSPQGGQPAITSAPAGAPKHPQKDIDKYEKEIIPQLQKKVNEATSKKDLPAMQQASGDLSRAQDFLRQMKAQGVEPTATPTMESEAQRTQALKTKKTDAVSQSREEKMQDSKQRWESNKLNILRVLNDTETDPGDLGGVSGSAAEGGESKYEAQVNWLMKHKDKLAAAGIKPKDGGELNSDSVIFVDGEGRSIRFSAILNALLEDPRLKGAQSTTHEAPGGRQVTISVGKPVKVE